MKVTEAYPLQWPVDWKRTKPSQIEFVRLKSAYEGAIGRLNAGGKQ